MYCESCEVLCSDHVKKNCWWSLNFEFKMLIYMFFILFFVEHGTFIYKMYITLNKLVFAKQRVLDHSACYIYIQYNCTTSIHPRISTRCIKTLWRFIYKWRNEVCTMYHRFSFLGSFVSSLCRNHHAEKKSTFKICKPVNYQNIEYHISYLDPIIYKYKYFMK